MKQLISFLLLSVCISGVFMTTSCNKLSNSSYLPVNDTTVVKKNVVVVDPLSYTLVSTTSQIDNGEYIYTYNSNFNDFRHNADFQAGNIIVGSTNGGYIRKIISVSPSSTENKVSVFTQAAKLEDVFETAVLSFSAMLPGTNSSADGIETEINDKTIYNDYGNYVMIVKGKLSCAKPWMYQVIYNSGSLTTVSGHTADNTLIGDFTYVVNATHDGTINLTDSTLLSEKSKTVFAGKIPLLMRTRAFVTYQCVGSIAKNVRATINTKSKDTFSVNNTFVSNAWRSNHNIVSAGNVDSTVVEYIDNTDLDIATGLRLVTTINNMPVSIVYLPIHVNLTGSVSGNNKDMTVKQFFAPRVNEKAYVYGYAPLDFSGNYTGDTASGTTPYRLVKVSGDNQMGSMYSYLPQPITVKVTDGAGNAQRNIAVSFKVTNGGGGVTKVTVFTDAYGLAQTSWQLGMSGTQTLQASVKNAAGAEIPGSPVSFSARL